MCGIFESKLLKLRENKIINLVEQVSTGFALDESWDLEKGTQAACTIRRGFYQTLSLVSRKHIFRLTEMTKAYQHLFFCRR